MRALIETGTSVELDDHEFGLDLDAAQLREMWVLSRLQQDAEEIRFDLSPEELIREAIEVNHRQVPSPNTLRDYEKDLEHFVAYLDSVCQRCPYTAQQKHIAMFINHLKAKGGPNPHKTRKDCTWCSARSYPDGLNGTGWAPSSIKGSLSAIRFLYHHFYCEEDLPSIDPSVKLRAPKVQGGRQWTPTKKEVKALLQAPGKPTDKLLAYWLYFAPSRAEPLRQARWQDIDLDGKTWTLIGKGGKPDQFRLNDELVQAFEEYKDWIERRALTNDKIRDALSNPETSFVLLTRNGKQFAPQQVGKMLKRRAVRAGVAVINHRKDRNHSDGKSSRVSPHALRRAWADHALNDAENPVPLDVVAEVLRHSDISTTRRHYAPTKPSRAQDALASRKL